ncbi:unnamed protein product [Rhizoctonia solani]|uniref:Uncharacterized protein n=1 Tax=Rhizoctonia solani TaxID=456999 RepID=A0A8H3BCB4_9AGAM|nr:unnamed protein product [Rhizoctonia solani]
MSTLEEGKHTFRVQGFNQVKSGSATTGAPPPSQAETLMSTQEAKERAESNQAAVEKGKAKEVQTTPATTRSQHLAASATKPASSHTNAPANSPQMNDTATAKTGSTSTAAGTLNVPTPRPTTRTTTTPDTPNTPSTLPLKRGPGRPRKSDVNTGPPPAKRPRGRPRNVTTPASLARQRNEASDEDIPNAPDSEDSDYRDSSDEPVVPPHILAQFNAHVALLRTRLDSRGIPEQYSIYKAFWLATRSTYFDNSTTAPPGRFLYWDPLFITSVGCPVCQQPLAIAAGGGWLDAPLAWQDEDGPCWIIGRRYVCTQCFAATEEAAKYVQVPSTNPEASDNTSGETKPQVLKPDFSSPVYYLSWEKRFRVLLPPTLTAEFPKPKRVQKRAAFNRASLGIELTTSGDRDVDMDAEGEPEGEDEEEPKRSRRVRHCMKCGSKDCPGRLSRARCSNSCHDCGLLTCDGRTKPNVTCKGELAAPFKQTGQDESSIASETSPTVPTAPAPNWPAGLPQIPSGFVLAIPYPVGADGKPTGAQSAMAYLVPQGEVPGFSFTKSQPGPSSEAPANGTAGSNVASTSAQLLAPAPAPGSVSTPAAASAALAPASGSDQTTPTPTTVDPPVGPQPTQPQEQGNTAQPKTNAQPRAASKQKTPQQKLPAQAPNPAQLVNHQVQPAPTVNNPHPHPSLQPPHHHQPHPPVPPPHLHPHHAPHAPPYHPQPGAPYYTMDTPGFYPYGYMPPYGYGYYPPPYPQPHGQNPPVENPPPGPPYPHYPPYPPPGHPYPPPNGPYPAPPPGASSAPPNGFSPMPPQPPQPPQPAQPQPQPQYMPYQPLEANRAATTAGPATRKRKGPAPGDKATET